MAEPILTDDEIEELKFWLGYTNVTAVAIGYIDFPAVFETVIKPNMSDFALIRIRTIIFPNLRQIEQDIMDARERYQADKAKTIVLNKQEHERLLTLKGFFVAELETMTGIKSKSGGGGSVLEVY